MVITGKGLGRPDGSPKDVDREIVALFEIMDENRSPYLEENLRRFAQPPYPARDDVNFTRSNRRLAINGYIFGNGPMITMRKDEHVRWYVMGMGGEQDLHTPHWHGNSVLWSGMRMDTVSLLPATMITADMVPDDVGTWLFHCHVNEHLLGGMITRYQVLTPDGKPGPSSDSAGSGAAGAGTGATSSSGSASGSASASSAGSPSTKMPIPAGGVPAGEGGTAHPSSFPIVPVLIVFMMALGARRLIVRRRTTP